MAQKRFVSEEDCCGYYTEIIDNEKELDLSLHNPKKNLTIEELVDLLNELNEENKKLKENYVELETSFDVCANEKRALETNILAIKEVMCKDIGYSDMQKQIEEILND